MIVLVTSVIQDVKRRRAVRGHNRSDTNCIHWRYDPTAISPVCPPCRLTGGYVGQQRHAEAIQ